MQSGQIKAFSLSTLITLSLTSLLREPKSVYDTAMSRGISTWCSCDLSRLWKCVREWAVTALTRSAQFVLLRHRLCLYGSALYITDHHQDITVFSLSSIFTVTQCLLTHVCAHTHGERGSGWLDDMCEWIEVCVYEMIGCVYYTRTARQIKRQWRGDTLTQVIMGLMGRLTGKYRYAPC